MEAQGEKTMDIRQPPNLKKLEVELPLELVEQVDEVVEYAKEELELDADRDRVIEHVIREHLRSNRQDARAFRDRGQEK